MTTPEPHSTNNTAFTTPSVLCHGKADSGLQADNPCWGSPSECDLRHLLTRLAEKPNQPVVYESKDYVVLNKPPDLRMDGPFPATVHKLLTYWYPPPSLQAIPKSELIDAVTTFHQHNDVEDNELRPCHQLDYATSGLLCIARTQEAAAYATQQWEDRQVSKEYLAIVHGHILPDKESPLPVLEKAKMETMLKQLEQDYRASRQRPRKDTFLGFQPPHAIFHKWKAVQVSAAGDENKKRKKRKAIDFLLTESDWQQIWKPLEGAIDHMECQKLEWKQICKTNVLWKRAFQAATNVHNDILRQALKDRQDQEDSKDFKFPTVFRVREEGSDEPNKHILYISCPLGQSPNEFAMKVPPHIAKDFPHLQQFVGPPDLDYKPSVTKCTILQHASYKPCDSVSTNRKAATNELVFISLPETPPVEVSKVQLLPLTGRRHQLRVHMALLGHAILGDATYEEASTTSKATSENAQRGIPPRMCLHSHKLSLKVAHGTDKVEFAAADPFTMDEDGKLDLRAI